MEESRNPRLFNNCRGRNYFHHYGTEAAFFDLNRFGEQDDMARDLEEGEECIVATQNEERTIATFQWYRLTHEERRIDKDGQRVRVQYGRKMKKLKRMSKVKAAKSVEFGAFFDKNAHFRRRSVV
jgi:hypothetical protein